MATEKKYYPIHLQRSDGQGYANDAENSEPVGPKDDRLTRWRAVIGSHLKYQLGEPGDTKLYILANLPEGYEMREIKSGKASNVYLFGHPSGTRYRTAGDFVPHVLWLVSDSVDRNDCFCTPCMDLVRKEGKQAPASVTPVPQAQGARGGLGQGLPSSKAGPAPAPQHANQVQQTQPAQQPQQHQQHQEQQQSQQLQQPQQYQQPQQTQQLQQVQQRAQQPEHQQPHQLQQTQQQYQASQYTQPQSAPSTLSDMGISSLSNIFRVAELVWFKDRAWRLGIVMSISPKTGAGSHNNPTPDDSQYIFTLAPLGHAGLRKPNAAKEASEMRPFLTFSVPDSPHFQGKSFNDIDWTAEAEKARQNSPNPAKAQQDMEMLGLEASKVAARTINNCFSLFNKQEDHRGPAASGFSMEFYGGVFLGAEMIVVGDSVRVTPPPQLPSDGDDKPTTVMRVDEIVLLIPHARNQAVNLQFRGAVYHLTRHAEHEIDHAASAAETAALGPTFREEVDFRNSLLDPNDRRARGRWTWRQVERPAFRSDEAIHGRFYVSHKLMQILMPDRLQEAVRGRVIPQESTLLNTRQQNGGGLPYAGRMLDRRSCLGLSVGEGALALPGGVREEFNQSAGAGAGVR